VQQASPRCEAGIHLNLTITCALTALPVGTAVTREDQYILARKDRDRQIMSFGVQRSSLGIYVAISTTLESAHRLVPVLH